MFKVKILSVGKTKESWLQEALAEYTQRLKPRLTIEWILTKTDAELKQMLEKEKDFFCLDPNGKDFTSEAFSTFLMQNLEIHHSRLTFVIGGSEGIDADTLKRASKTLSLSKLTFTHQMTRLVLVEQMYRALEIERGSSYHK